MEYNYHSCGVGQARLRPLVVKALGQGSSRAMRLRRANGESPRFRVAELGSKFYN
jgi:hypothetical protein